MSASPQEIGNGSFLLSSLCPSTGSLLPNDQRRLMSAATSAATVDSVSFHFDLPRLAPYSARSFMKILVCDPISPKAIALLQQRPEFEVTVLSERLAEPELIARTKDAVALVVRSE